MPIKATDMTFGGWMIEFEDSITQLKANYRLIHSVSLCYYEICRDGQVKLMQDDSARVPRRFRQARRQGGRPAEDPGLIRWAQRQGVKVYANIGGTAGGTPSVLPAGIIGAAGDRCVHEIVALCSKFGYDGFDIDFEEMAVDGRDPYTLFIAKLVSALHAMKPPRLVSSTLQAVPSREAERQTAFDYHVLGRLADHVRVMCFDYSDSSPGPLMPRAYFARLLAYARSCIPAEKFIAALPWYGRDWRPAGSSYKSADILWMQRESATSPAGMEELKERFHVKPRWREPEGEYTFRYERDGELHEVWMPDPRKFTWMVRAVRRAGAAGVYVWHLAYASPEHWKAVRTVLLR